MKCKICEEKSDHLFAKKVLNKYDVKYYQCSTCFFIQTEEPYWLNEAYASAITSLDIGLLQRNLIFLQVTISLINSFFHSEENFVDYGGGYGIFCRLMRDKGFNYYRQDIYCENLFAKPFDISDRNESGKFEMLTAFEVFEHLVNPQEELDKMLQLSDNIFFSTELGPQQKGNNDDWWYIMPETGQHISLFTAKSLSYLAKKKSLNFYTNNTDLHLFTKKKLSPFFFKLLTQYKVAKLFNTVSNKRKTLLPSDYQLVLNNIRNKA